MRKLSLALIAAALTAIGGMAANALPLPAGTLAPAAGVPGPFDDNMFVFKPGTGVLSGLGATTSDINNCVSPLIGGCLFQVPNPLGVPLDGNLGLTLVYDSLGTTLTDIFGVQCNGVSCNLAYLSQIGTTPIDTSGLDLTTAYSVNAVAGAPVTVFDASYYLPQSFKDANRGVFARFVSTTNIPEPMSLSVFGAGMLGAAALRRRKRG